ARSRLASTIGISIRSGGMGKKIPSQNANTASHQGPCGLAASRIIRSYNERSMAPPGWWVAERTGTRQRRARRLLRGGGFRRLGGRRDRHAEVLGEEGLEFGQQPLGDPIGEVAMALVLI